jgi:hypothetical protein
VLQRKRKIIDVDPNVAIAIGTGLAAITAIAAAIISVIVYRGQAELSRVLSREQSETSKKISSDQAALSQRIHENQMLLSQRQLLIPLWTHMSVLRHINPDNPIEPDVLQLVNTLELVAVSCEGGMVDAQVIKRVFRDLFMQFYEEINAVKMLPGRKISGPQLLNENRAAMKFYRELQDEHINRDKLD